MNSVTLRSMKSFSYCKKMFIYTNTWITGKKFDEISLSKKENFYSSFRMEDIIDAGYNLTKMALWSTWNKNLRLIS